MSGATHEQTVVGFLPTQLLVKCFNLAPSTCLLSCHYQELTTKDPSRTCFADKDFPLWKNLMRNQPAKRAPGIELPSVRSSAGCGECLWDPFFPVEDVQACH
ncbi:hypothetical protein N1851_000424 [Merluccius polli]|uniref:Uncharacterized protein n=1 Tax=Merluccius polli TaxID=89951 RepID=A0AA47PDY1_MERPO|nr:hypothetical protein N1851_000424 [Merluccius polli]